jgi:hypothetical protein
MAIKSNSSEQEVSGVGKKLYTGITAMSVVAVNPTLDELQAMDIMYQSEPNYTVDFGNGEVQKVVFWLKNEDITVPMELLITPGPWKSKTGKYKWLNNQGQETWAEENADGTVDTSSLMDWFKAPETCYKVARGADTLTEFVKVWANVAPGDEVRLDTLENIEEGDMTELRELIKALANNKLRVLVFVRDGKYQGVYTRHFGRLVPQRNDLFLKAMNQDYGQVKGEYSIEWGEYKPGVLTPDPVGSTTEISEDSDWLTEPAGVAEDDLDELPF